MKKAATPSTGGEKGKGDKTSGSGEAGGVESKLTGEASTSSSSSFSEELQGFTSASEIYSVRSPRTHCSDGGASDNPYIIVLPLFLQLKRKRVGAGLRGSSDPFKTAKDLLELSMLNTAFNKGTESGGFYNEGSGESSVKGNKERTNTDMSSAVTSSIRDAANAVAATAGSPTKAGKAMSKKQQKLAEAAKSSRNISQYFAKKQTTEESPEEPPELKGPDDTVSQTSTSVQQEDIIQLEDSLSSVEAMESSPVESEAQDVTQEERREEVILIADDDEEETHQTETLEQIHDTSHQELRSANN